MFSSVLNPWEAGRLGVLKLSFISIEDNFVSLLIIQKSDQFVLTPFIAQVWANGSITQVFICSRNEPRGKFQNSPSYSRTPS